MKANKTEGDGETVRCPHCDKKIRHGLRDEVLPGRVEQTLGICPVCHKVVHYQAAWELRVVASTERVS